MSALSDGNLEEALKLFTEAIKCNPSSAPVLAKLKRPSAALKDCERAIAANPDSAQAYMWKGRANMLLGNFTTAQNDFSQSARIDPNETLQEWIADNKANANKMREYNNAVERQKTERLIKEKKERIRKAKEENERAAREAAESAGAADKESEGRERTSCAG